MADMRADEFASKRMTKNGSNEGEVISSEVE